MARVRHGLRITVLALVCAGAAHAGPAQNFQAAAAPLAPALRDYCAGRGDLETPRRQWRDALHAWERLAAVALGPLLERRAQMRLDFTPVRPKSIEKAVKSAPASLADLERIGAPAKGLPALEWLLWSQPLAAAGPECDYAILLAQDLHAEARALAVPAAAAALGERVNQWVAGLERLRWSRMEMPARVAMTSGKPADFPRAAAKATAAAWAAHWQGLKEQAPPDAGVAAFATALAEADAAMARADPARLDSVLAAAARLAALKRVTENELAPALGVVIGFSDSDGD